MSAGNDVTERLQALLAERGLRPGERLPPERALAAELGVSRAHLREGMRRLLDLGILEARRGSGTYLAAVDLLDLLEARLRLEPYAARLAAQRRSPAAAAGLERLLGELRAAHGDPAAFAAADARLHAAVTEAAGSVALGVLLAALGDLLRHSRATSVVDPALPAATLRDAEQLVRAIRDGDAAGAERAMRAHLQHVGSALASAR